MAPYHAILAPQMLSLLMQKEHGKGSKYGMTPVKILSPKFSLPTESLLDKSCFICINLYI